jgi:hypothetical protein
VVSAIQAASTHKFTRPNIANLSPVARSRAVGNPAAAAERIIPCGIEGIGCKGIVGFAGYAD